MRVGVVADTHCPEFLDALPERVFEALAGVDLILHAGDVNGTETLSQLERLAPVRAIKGDHDKRLELPRSIEFEIEGKRVVLTHGNRSRWIEEPVTFVGTISLGRLWLAPRLHRWLRQRFPTADVIVYGHTHAPANQELDGKLLFNPGAVYQVTPAEARRRLAKRPNWFEWTWLQVIRHRRHLLPPSVGILEFVGGDVKGTIIPL